MALKKKRLSLKDIARELGVSTATVSLAINNNPLVAEKTRQLVQAKVKELGYVYNRGAASLITGKSGMIGLAVHDFTNPYFTEICANVEAVFAQGNRLPLLCNSRESLEQQTLFINALIEQNADGLLLCPVVGSDMSALQPLLNSELPTVLVTRNIDGAEMDFVGNDERLSIRMATEHLLKLGHTRIAFVGGQIEAKAAQDRNSGYRDALEAAGIEVDNSLIFACDNQSVAAENLLPNILQIDSPPTAIVGFSDVIALGLLSGLLSRQLEPGKDIALVGCDNIEESSRYYSQLTTVHVQKDAIGATAAEFLLQRLADPSLPQRQQLFTPELIVRRSCGAYLQP
ncbi:LacI family transcriptional regulator [Marinomonas agarivorans]|nr:LacI family transcriptional regulator [Marinomonas agarivorans]